MRAAHFFFIGSALITGVVLTDCGLTPAMFTAGVAFLVYAFGRHLSEL
jgi:hypothetical protein